MSEKLYFLIGFLVCLVVGGWFLVKGLKTPTAPTITSTATVSVGNVSNLTDQSYTTFGNIPVTVKPEEQGKDNPFQP